ncbi:RidA family protein [Brevundimonas vancanneytii]|uniref:Enamine/imine deaminase n=1 Tax=Brevundimonas vancanneytii TaxID=1325724 RepID=A0A4P1JR28_9CAUL|nr:RidA family protein [Brevundimonas vancanneytii]VTO10575.1 Enamine/imine deaminase [Brevundimonas vancanneytii]
MITRIQPDSRMSQAVIHGQTIYLAGQVGEPGEDVAAQTRTALAEVEAILAECGSDKSKILSAQVWLADIADFEAMNGVWDAWVDPANPPARATCEAKLATSDYLVEVIVVAAALTWRASSRTRASWSGSRRPASPPSTAST